MKNDSEINVFVEITNFMRNSLKKSSFLQISRVLNASKITKKIFSGNYFRNDFVSEGTHGRSILELCHCEDGIVTRKHLSPVSA